MSGAYYNEIDPYAAEWLRNLIAADEIAAGEVDERDIREVQADDIRGFEQVHLFAGIGGWSLALRLAGWGDYRPCWTGSPPCQPFSDAGKRVGTDDTRHLWPEFYRLIRECRPEQVLGEQVPGAVRLGWLDGVSADLEAEGYAVGAVFLGAHSAGAPHIRNRIWWGAQRMADANGVEARPNGVRDKLGEGRRLGDSEIDGVRPLNGQSSAYAGSKSPHRGPGVFVDCADGFRRRISSESCDVPLADGVSEVMGSRRAAEAPSRSKMLRGYGNAIVPQTAAIFVRAWMGAWKKQENRNENCQIGR